MSRIRVSTMIDATPAEVWQAIEDIPSHVEWMEDAVAIRMQGRRREGKGTTFECDTKVGPFKLVDRMEVTQWKPRRAMGVRHVGMVTGEGRFTLRRRRGGRTKFTWTEELHFPLWMGGGLGGIVGARVMARIWKRNLRNLKRRVEGAR